MRVLCGLAVCAVLALSDPALAETGPSLAETSIADPAGAEMTVAEPDDAPEVVEKGPPIPGVKDPSLPHSEGELTFREEDGGCSATHGNQTGAWWLLLAAPLLIWRRRVGEEL